MDSFVVILFRYKVSRTYVRCFCVEGKDEKDDEGLIIDSIPLKTYFPSVSSVNKIFSTDNKTKNLAELGE